MVKTHRSARGFTLMEVILVLIVGAILLAGGTLIYNQLRENAGSAAANSRAMALQGLVEKLASADNGNLPSTLALRAAWAQSRPDWASSPWGARAQCRSTDAAEVCSEGIRAVTVCPNDMAERCYRDLSITGDSGVLVYLRYFDKPGRLRTYLDVWDNTQKLVVHTSRFAVAAENPDGRQFYFVHGPPDLDDSTGRPREPDSTWGKSGNCSCFDGAIDIGDQYGR